MRKSTQLKQLILSPEILVMPGAYDAISAKIIEALGFKAVQCSGYAIAASRGFPDIGLLSFGEMLQATKVIVDSVDIPVMADGNTGYGGPLNVYRTVREFIRIGAAGVNLEDQVWPKRCGHMEGKRVIPLEEMVEKVRAAVKAREDEGDPDFVLNIRTDAIAVYGKDDVWKGVEEAIRRGNAYADAGADLIFVEAPPTVEAIKAVVKGIKAPVSINMLEGGKTPLLTVDELQKMGVARVSCPLTALFSAAGAMWRVLSGLKEKGTTKPFLDEMMTFSDFNRLIGLEKFQALEAELGGQVTSSGSPMSPSVEADS